MTSDATPRFKLLTPANLIELPEPSWLVAGVLPADALAVLYGPPSSYKTFLALSIAASIAAGHNWCGKPTKAGSVLYVAAEGLRSFQTRMPAYERKHGIVVDKIRYLGADINLLAANDVDMLLKTLAEHAFKPDLIVMDTLARLIPGADENSSQEMGRAIGAMDRLRRANGSTILLVHHTGKDGESERGSSALRGAADVMIKCKAAGSTLHLNCDKMKEAEPFASMKIGLEQIKINAASSSLAVAAWQQAPDAGTEQDGAALEVLEHFGSAGATNKEWGDAYTKCTGRAESTFDRALRNLKAKGAVCQEGRRYYAVQVEEKCQVSSRGVNEVS